MKTIFLSLFLISCNQIPGHWEVSKPAPTSPVGGTQNLKTMLQHTEWQRFDDGRLTWRYSFTDGQFGPNGFCARPFGQAVECAPGWVWGVTLPSIITIWNSQPPPDSVFAWKVFLMTQDSMILRPVIFNTGEYGEQYTLIRR
jgi:hypothetical protein